MTHGEMSDGYHTFSELYRYRMLYNAALFNEWAAQSRYDVHKARHHADGWGAPGWFIVVAELPTGQISNRYRDRDWECFHIPARARAADWDRHTPAQAAERLAAFIDTMPGRAPA